MRSGQESRDCALVSVSAFHGSVILAASARIARAPGESLRSATLHGIHSRRWLCDGDDRRCAFCVPTRRGRKRRGISPFALCRPNWVAFTGNRWRRQETGAVWLWRGCPYRGAGREVAGANGVCLYAAGRCNHSGLRPAPRRGMGGWIRRDAARAARCCDHLCNRWRSRALGAEGGPQGRSCRLRGYPYERHPEFPLSATLGRASGRIRRQSHTTGWNRFPAPGRRWVS